MPGPHHPNHHLSAASTPTPIISHHRRLPPSASISQEPQIPQSAPPPQCRRHATPLVTTLPTFLPPYRISRAAARPLRLLNRQEQLELRRQLLLRVQAVGEVDSGSAETRSAYTDTERGGSGCAAAESGHSPPDAAVGVDLNTERLDVVGTVRAAREVAQVELDLVPALVQAHRHRADERLDPRGRLPLQRTFPPSAGPLRREGHTRYGCGARQAGGSTA